MNLIEGLLSEIDRVKEIIKEYESLPNNAGAFAISMMNFGIEFAKNKMIINDTVGMIQALKYLKEYEL